METATKPTILIVEDDRGVATLQQRRLERAGFDTITATTTDEALTVVSSTDVGLILLDYRLPGSLNGLDFYAKLKSSNIDLPVIMVTGVADEATVIRALRTGVRDFVTKSPEYLDYLPEAVARVLKEDGIERRLAESEAGLAGIISSAMDAIITVDDQQVITLFNPAAERMFGCAAKQAVGQPLSRFVPEQFASGGQVLPPWEPSEETFTSLRTTGSGVRAGGEQFLIEASVSLIDCAARQGCSIVIRDITEQRKAEKRQAALYTATRALAEAGTIGEAMPRVLEAIVEGIEWDIGSAWQVTRDDKSLRCIETWVSPAWNAPAFCAQSRQAIFARDQGMPGRAWAEGGPIWVNDIADEPGFLRAGTAISEGLHGAFALPISCQGETCGVLELFSRKPQKLDSDVLEMMTALGSQLGQCVARRRAEARLQEQATLLDKAQDAILVRDSHGRILFWNKGAERLYGWTAAEAIGRNAKELLDKRSSQEMYIAGRMTAARGEWAGEAVQVGKDGRELIVESRWSLVRDDDGDSQSYLVINTDITEKKKLEVQFLHAQRMESIGTLAGGVAHEFNNLLQAIRGYTRYAMEGLSTEEQRYQDLDQVVQAADRATALTRDLLSFGRLEPLERRLVDPNEVVTSLVKLLRPVITANIELEVTLAGNLKRIRADAGQLRQVLMNLCINARDAMPTGGRLSLSTEVVTLATDDANRPPDLAPGPYLVYTIADTGFGMSAEVQSRIFEPFFTTKEVGQGTGLGLAVAYGIVQQHGGVMIVSSQLDQGSKFKVFLPLVDGEEIAHEASDTGGVQGGAEVILLAEDEPLVCNLAVRILKDAGYEVITACDGIDAVRAFEDQADRISIVILDLAMPKLGGYEAYEQIQAIRPGTLAVFCSGYEAPSAQAEQRNGKARDKDVRLIKKPFDAEELLQTVREILDAKRPCLV